MPKPILGAVIVTFNRREKLATVLDSLNRQTRLPDRVFVIDNASTDGTGEYLSQLEDSRITHVRLTENLGGAGGFNAGCKIAYESGCDLVWLSDDDAYPEPTAIEVLENSLADFEDRFGDRPSFACSMVRWMNGDLCEMNTPQPVWDWPRRYDSDHSYFLVQSCSFVSVLVPRSSFEQHGYPISDYFIWCDDVEFTARLASSYPGLFCPDSQVRHDIPENKGVNFALIDDSNVWKYEYGARNDTSRRKRDQGLLGVAIFARSILIQMSQGNVPWKLRRRVLRSLFKGLFFRPEIEKP